jgi:hypothetical protein
MAWVDSLSMRESRSEKPVQPGSRQRAGDGGDHHRDAIADQREERSRTSSGERSMSPSDVMGSFSRVFKPAMKSVTRDFEGCTFTVRLIFDFSISGATADRN